MSEIGEKMNSKSKCLNTVFLEYVIWLRTKHRIYKYEIMDKNALFGYEQELIADLKEENGHDFFWVARCT